MATTVVSWEVVSVEKPDDVNIIIGQAHFIKTVEDLHEALVGVGGQLCFGVAFCEASGPCLVRRSGNDDELVQLATDTALAIGAAAPALADEARSRWVPAITEHMRALGIGPPVQAQAPAPEPVATSAFVVRPQPDGSLAVDVGTGVVVTETKSGGWLVEQSELSPARLADELTAMLADPARLSAAAEAARTQGRPDAAERLADLVETVAVERP